MSKDLYLKHIIGKGLIVVFLVTTLRPLPLAQAKDFYLPAPGVIVHLSPAFNPPILKGIKVHPDNPFRFDFILDQGDSPSLVQRGGQGELKQKSTKLIKYFLASLTIPEKDLWVNLSPYEKNRIIPQSFGLTEMGRDLLAEDYMLKQITASLIYPEDAVGKKFWKRIYEEAAKKFGTTNVPVNTFNKVWIVPEKAVVYENVKAGTAYVVESKLKVMLEQDYLALEKNRSQPGDMFNPERPKNVSPSTLRNELGLSAKAPQVNNGSTSENVSALASQIVREIVIPQLTKEVNEGKNFVQLRQVYNSLILATWYKKKIKDSILPQVYADKNKIFGLSSPNASIGDPEHIYQRYLQAFKKGVYNYIKEEQDLVTKEAVPRKYFSGGVAVFGYLDRAMSTTSDRGQLPTDNDSYINITADLLPEGARPQSYDDLKNGGWYDRNIKAIRDRYKLVEEAHAQSRMGLSMLQTYLDLLKNTQTAKVVQAVQSAFEQRKQIIVELGSGNTANALELARNNPESFVLATDIYQTKPTTFESYDYLMYAEAFEAGTLPAQKARLPNLMVVRSLTDILLYLPDASVGSMVFVCPTVEVRNDLIVLVNEMDVLRKLRPDAKVVIFISDGFGLRHLEDKLRFSKRSNRIFLNVDLGENTDWKRERPYPGLYLGEKIVDSVQLASDRAMVLISGKTSGPQIVEDLNDALKRALFSFEHASDKDRLEIIGLEKQYPVLVNSVEERPPMIWLMLSEIMGNALRAQRKRKIKVELFKDGNKVGVRILNEGNIRHDLLRKRANKLRDRLVRLPNGDIEVILYKKLEGVEAHKGARLLSNDEFSNLKDEDLLFIRHLSTKGNLHTLYGDNGNGMGDIKYEALKLGAELRIETGHGNTAVSVLFDRADQAMHSDKTQTSNTGGIDLTPAHMNLETKMDSRFRGNDNEGRGNDSGKRLLRFARNDTSQGIKFHLDPAQLAQLQNFSGFVPVIINIQPLKDLQEFLMQR